MTIAQTKASSLQLWRKILLRVIIIAVLTALAGLVMNHALGVMERRREPAGFYHGLLQGALMPAAMPNLLVGRDVTIYAQNNTGLTYKLGYTVGVNTCGAIFFGILFWRLNRWRKRINGK
jgi:ABC-type Fe3+ transport system permease subunit